MINKQNFSQWVSKSRNLYIKSENESQNIVNI